MNVPLLQFTLRSIIVILQFKTIFYQQNNIITFMQYLLSSLCNYVYWKTMAQSVLLKLQLCNFLQHILSKTVYIYKFLEYFADS